MASQEASHVCVIDKETCSQERGFIEVYSFKVDENEREVKEKSECITRALASGK